MNFQILETRRLFLKAISSEEMSLIFNQLKKQKIMEILGHRSEQEYLKEEFKHKNGYASYNRRFKLFLLTDKTSGLIIGRCGFHNWNADHARSEIGYVMEDENYKRKGLMGEALETIIDHGFTGMHLNRIEALVGPENIASLSLLEKNRFRKEGVLKQHFKTDKGYEDSVLFALLSDDYQKIKNK